MPMRCEAGSLKAAALAGAVLLGACADTPAPPVASPAMTTPPDARIAGVVEAESGGLRVLASFTGDEAWRDAFARPGRPDIGVVRALEPDGVASLVLVYSGPAVARPGFRLICRATVDAPEGRIFDGEPTPCSAAGGAAPDALNPSPFALVLRGQQGQRPSRLRATVHVSQVGSGGEIVLELPLDVAAGGQG